MYIQTVHSFHIERINLRDLESCIYYLLVHKKTFRVWNEHFSVWLKCVLCKRTKSKQKIPTQQSATQHDITIVETKWNSAGDWSWNVLRTLRQKQFTISIIDKMFRYGWYFTIWLCTMPNAIWNDFMTWWCNTSCGPHAFSNAFFNNNRFFLCFQEYLPNDR